MVRVYCLAFMSALFSTFLREMELNDKTLPATHRKLNLHRRPSPASYNGGGLLECYVYITFQHLCFIDM